MSRKKQNIPEKEKKDARFKRVSEPRILKMLHAINRVTKMTRQSNYLVYDVDAQKILDTCLPVINEFITTFTEIAENKTKSETTIDHIF